MFTTCWRASSVLYVLFETHKQMINLLTNLVVTTLGSDNLLMLLCNVYSTVQLKYINLVV